MPMESAVEPALFFFAAGGFADAEEEGADAAAWPPQGPNASMAQIKPDLSACIRATLARTTEPVELSGTTAQEALAVGGVAPAPGRRSR